MPRVLFDTYYFAFAFLIAKYIRFRAVWEVSGHRYRLSLLDTLDIPVLLSFSHKAEVEEITKSETYYPTYNF